MTERLSIVLPVYNEAGVIEEVIEELDREIAQKLPDTQIVVVNDRSTDETASILDRMAASNRRLFIDHSPRNQGHGPTLRKAIELSSGDWIFHIDSDGQFLAADFWKLWDRRHEADLVLGFRAVRHDPRHRLILTRVVRAMISLLAGHYIRDGNVPYRLLQRSLWADLSPLIGNDALAPSIMVSVGAAVRKRRILQIPVTHLARTHGVSTLRLGRLARFCGKALGQVLAYRIQLVRHR